MKWVTRKGVKFDRTACAWFIRRFVDPQAEFGFLTPEEMPAAIERGEHAFHDYGPPSERPAGTPIEKVNFPFLIERYGYDKKDPALPLMAEAVKKAERTGFAKDESANYGLWAIANGMWVNANRDDAAMVEQMMPVYDALYSYCKLRTEGSTGWTTG